ncbi:hypothetical protein NS383_18865 [Pseudomonas oryzihabitans]|nr:hypothetical protein NS383_18865 [Pseudomonas psychrotolerans]
MQLSIDQSRIQIHIAGQGMIRLNRAGKCVGFAETYRNAELRAVQLDRFFAQKDALSRLAVDTTDGVSFCSKDDAFNPQSVDEFTPSEWQVETVDGLAIQRFASQMEADNFARALRSYNLDRPVSGEDGQWTDAQIAWWDNHPAPAVADCHSFQVRAVPPAGRVH